MNKPDIINALAVKLNKTKAEVTRFYEAHWNLIEKTLKKWETISIRGFGTFKKKTRPARIAVNPKTKEVIKVREKNVVSFKLWKNLKNF